MLDHTTLVSERTILQLGAWHGLLPGPDRPWLIHSTHCAFLTLSDRRARDREGVLLRANADSFAGGTLYWQAENDVHELDLVTSAEDAPAPANRPREALLQWAVLRDSNRWNHVVGPRGPGNAPNLQLRERLRPGRIEPADLMLSRDQTSGRAQPDIGADLPRMGILPRLTRPVRGGTELPR